MYCVIVGDMVNSREMTQDERANAGIIADEVFGRINSEFQRYLLSGFELSSGDSFEAVLLAHYIAPQLIQRIIKELYPVTRLRIGVALGDLYTFGSNFQDVNAMDGPAFHEAADIINHLKKSKSNHWLQFSISSGKNAQPLVQAVISMLCSMTKRWTDRQRQVIWDYERLNKDIGLLSKEKGISNAAIHKHLKAADYIVYRNAWIALEDYLANIETADLSSTTEIGYLAYFNLACHNFDAGKYLLAEEFIKKSLELAKDQYGSDSPLLIPILNIFAEILCKDSRFSEAIDFLQQALLIQNALPLGRDSNLYTLYLLGIAQYMEGFHEFAQDTMQKGKAIEVTWRGTKPAVTIFHDDIFTNLDRGILS